MALKYGVFDSNQPASVAGFPWLKNCGWDTHIFESFAEAQKYAAKWLGKYAHGTLLELNKPYAYSGYGDTIEIRTIGE